MTVKITHSQKSGRTRIPSGQKQNKFIKTVLGFYKKHGRHHLPWRKTSNPYKILVSEVMLQQTQVGRVIPYYKAFLKQFPTVRRLASAPLSSVLRLWQGLGYNRRAKMLHEAAKTIVTKHGDTVPEEKTALIELPGIGAYTASAIRVFAFDKPEVLLETNIRAAYLHHFFPHKKKVHDRTLYQSIAKILDRKNPRTWYVALMDYGAHLKKTVPNPSRRSAHHTKQKPFKGSDREIRGAILKFLSRKSVNRNNVFTLDFSKIRIEKQLTALLKEGLIEKNASRYILAD